MNDDSSAAVNEAVQSVVHKQSFLHSVKLVVWAFLGIRSSSGYQQDLARVNPLHVVLVGVVGALMFVAGLMVFVNWVVAK